MRKPKFNVGDKVKTVLHGVKVVGKMTKFIPDDPAGLAYHFSFNDGTNITMDWNRVNQEVVGINDNLPDWMEKKIKKLD